MPSRLGVTELARLAAGGACPAGPCSLPAGTGRGIEVERMVNAAGLAGAQVNVGFELAGQRVTLRMDGTQMAVIGQDGALLRALPCPVPPRERHRLRGARPGHQPAASGRASHHSFQIDIDGQTVTVVPRTTSKEIHRYKAAAHFGGSGTWGSQDRSS